MTAPTCISCTHWRLRESGGMARNGFAFCAVSTKRYTYLPPQHTCARHFPAVAGIASARAEWLAGKGIPTTIHKAPPTC